VLTRFERPSSTLFLFSRAAHIGATTASRAIAKVTGGIGFAASISAYDSWTFFPRLTGNSSIDKSNTCTNIFRTSHYFDALIENSFKKIFCAAATALERVISNHVTSHAD
jgi:hypothetical protein